jgi:hypothetical protein
MGMALVLAMALQDAAPEKASLSWNVKRGQKFTAVWSCSSTEEDGKARQTTVDKREIEMDLLVENESAMSLTVRKAALTRETPGYVVKVTHESETWSPRKPAEKAKHEAEALALCAAMKRWLGERYALRFDDGGLAFWVLVKKGTRIYDPFMDRARETPADGWMTGTIGESVFGAWGVTYKPPQPEIRSGQSWSTGLQLLGGKDVPMKVSFAKERLTLTQAGSNSKTEKIVGGKASCMTQEKIDRKIVVQREGWVQSVTTSYEKSETTTSSDEFWRGSKKTKIAGSLTLKKS